MRNTKRWKKMLLIVAFFCILLLMSPAIIVLVMAPFNSYTGAETDFSGSRFLAAPPPLLQKETTLKLVTYNIAIAHGFTTNHRERLVGVVEKMRELKPDIVGFQEVFIAEERLFLLEAMKELGLSHHAEYPAGLLGNGLLTVSAWPIAESYFLRYKHNNPFYVVWEGDWWAGKGAGLARVELPDGAIVDFYNTHAQAGRGNPANEVVRLEQMRELTEFVNATHTGTAPAFVLGDFNTRVGREDLELLTREAGLVRVMNMDSRIDHIFALKSPHYTFEVLDTVLIEGTVMGSRTGHFFSRAPTPTEFWEMYYGPGTETPLSDHPGYATTVRIVPVAQPVNP